METTIITNPALVVALDIGTTYSGYAFQWRQDHKEPHSSSAVEFNTNWGDGTQLHKTKTCILLNKHKQLDSIGGLAEKRYSTEVDKDPDHVRGNWFFFEYFKTYLYHEGIVGFTSTKFDSPTNQNACYKKVALELVLLRVLQNLPLPRGTTKTQNIHDNLEDPLGQHMAFKEVLALFIEGLRGHFTKSLEDKNLQVCPNKTLWVVTVPAVWSDKAKKFVREAAESSGIDRRHLLLALEPECASIYCINLPTEQRQRMNKLGEPGDQFVTVDAGGGTLDITAIKVRSDGFLTEICSMQGAQIGGNDVNNAFLQACKDVLDGDAWHNTFTEKNAMDLFNFQNEFERKKVSIGSERDEYISLTIPHSLRDMLKEGKVRLKPEAKYTKYFNTEDGKFQFKSEFIRELLFKEVLNQLIEALKKVLKNEQLVDVRTLVLVGGFAESHIVRETIDTKIKELYPRLVVVGPTSPSRAVLMGAVAYGFNPRIFRSRIARATYGVKIAAPFDPKVHKPEYKKTFNGDPKEYCQNIFSIHVQKDQSVVLSDQQPSRVYNPVRPQQKKLAIRIFTSSERTPVYTTEESCTELGKIVVHCPDTHRGKDRDVKVTMVYGGTELTVVAEDESTGREYKTDITFD